MSPFEVALAKSMGSVVARKATKTISKRSFPQRVVKQLRGYDDLQKLTRGQIRDLKKLLGEEKTWLILVDARRASDEELAVLIAAEVFGDESNKDGSLLLAQRVRAVTAGALELEGQANFIVSNVRDVGDDVAATRHAVSAVGDNVAAIRDIVAIGSATFDPAVLINGPLVVLGVLDEYERATSLVDTDPKTAIEILTTIVDKMVDGGYQPLARDLRIERARLFSEAGMTEAAIDAWTDLAVDMIDRGISSHDAVALSSLEALAAAPDAPEWTAHRSNALHAAHSWHVDPNADGAAIMEHSALAAHAADPRATLLLRIASEACLASSNPDAIASHLDIARSLSTADVSEDCVRLRLALADVSGDWDALEQLAEVGTGSAAPREAALIFARRGRALLFSGDPTAAARFFSRAVERGCTASVWQDAAAWTLGRVRALSRAGIVSDEINQLALQASNLRATGNSSLVKRAYDARSSAMDAMLANRLSAALPLLRRHLRDSLWSGQVEAEIAGHQLLGDLYDRTGREASRAIKHLVAGGDGKRAAEVAKSSDEYVNLLPEATGPDATVRESAFRATTAMADVVPDDQYPAWVDACIEAIEDKTGVFFAPKPWVPAFALLAELARRGLTADQFDRVLASVDRLIPREPNHYTYADDSIVDLIANLAVSTPDRLDYLADRVVAILQTSPDMSSGLEGRGDALYALGNLLDERLAELAADGNKNALNILALRKVDDPAIQASATEEIEASIASGDAYFEGGVSMLADVAGSVKFAYAAPPHVQEALARDFTRRANDTNDLESNRAQAASGVDMMAEFLSDILRDELFTSLEPLGNADTPLSTHDEMNQMFSHPLGTMRMNLGEGHLQRSAVGALAALAFDDRMAARAWDLVQLLMQSSSPRDHRAAAMAIYRLSSKGLQVPYSWPMLATAADPRLRQAAAALLGVADDFDDDRVVTLAGDADLAVRREVATALPNIFTKADALGSRVREVLDKDRHFRVRNYET